MGLPMASKVECCKLETERAENTAWVWLKRKERVLNLV